MKDFEIQVLCDDGLEHVAVVLDAKDLDEACDIAFNDALELGHKPVQCEPVEPVRPATNWDPIDPEPLYNDDGQCIGQLMPRMTQEQLAASPGIQSWSTPAIDTRFA